MLPEWVFDADDRSFMAAAIAEAEAAAARGEVPVGAVVTLGGEIVARSGNRRQEQSDPAAHAEIIVLREAGRVVGDWRLSGQGAQETEDQLRGPAHLRRGGYVGAGLE